MFAATLSLSMSTPTYETATLPDLSIKYVAGNAFSAYAPSQLTRRDLPHSSQQRA
jgi:hypothetical protein